MSTLTNIGVALKSVDLSAASLVLSIVVFYLLFQTIVIFSSTAGLEGQCLYTFWTPNSEWWKNPFWLVVTIVLGLLALSAFMAIEGLGSSNRSKLVAGSASALVLGLWLYGLNGLWDAMLFEKGELSAEEWYQHEDGPRGLALLEEEHVCTPDT